MNPREFAIKVLQEKGEVMIRCNGNSMRPIIAPKEAIYLKRVNHSLIRVGDAVFCRINGNLQVHKVSAIQNEHDYEKRRFQISNNHGHVNGWIGGHSIFGLAVRIEDRVLVSDAELRKRDGENEIPPPDWKPSAKDIKRMKEAPKLDPDDSLGGKAEEEEGRKWLEEQEKFTPYGRHGEHVQITEEDAKKLRGVPEPLRIIVPAEIEETKKAEVGAVERIICMDEVDLECSYCHGLVAHSFCSGKELIHCVHCGNPMKTAECKKHKVDKKQEVPRHACPICTPEEIPPQPKDPDLSAYTNPPYRLSDEAYQEWLKRLRQDPNERND